MNPAQHIAAHQDYYVNLAADAGGTVDEAVGELDALPVYRSTVGCVIPAYNEAETLAGVLDSLLCQTRLPDAIHVVVNNSTDNTIEIATHYAGLHTRVNRDSVDEFTEIFVHDIGENKDKKVGALNYGYSLVEGMDFFLGVDGDTTADPQAVERLLSEIEHDQRIGGISAIYSIDDTDMHGVVERFLIAGQRQQFASFNLQNLLRGRQMAVLGGQFSIFRMSALARVVEDNHQDFPWVRDSEIEDSLLSLQIRSAGYLTKISADARANVGGMTTLRSIDAQQVKWLAGAIDLMWPGQRGDTKGQPFHPNLRLRWFEMGSMVLNAYTRFSFFVLLTCSLLFSAFVFNALWLIPPLVATLLNFRIVRAMKNANRRDYLFALLWLPSEIYIWTRMGHFARAWTKFFSRTESDNWALQSRAESGGGSRAFLAPFVVATVLWGAAVAVFQQLPEQLKSDTLYVGWTSLAIMTLLQTAWLLLKCLRRFRGYKV
ncbi:glycosyltransferase [Nocardioides sp. zg-536]|uniref:Glycosyltransferase n=2 Tax=Nocardioides faecalis TaxID=2803858 RepID=A0A938Y8V5_9ACTN|nr:glycosyltransferase [Nocardioides faecalis]MBS4751763.1 glycosyltransferase [Nocardioides faecalis]QVI60441.1 glycosyltransferase [Nocardioides faecalis]